MGQDLAASVRARLLNIAKAEQTDFNAVLVRYALERFLYRLSQSAHADHFVLKGAMLFNLWYAMPHRPTRDVDLLGFGASDLDAIAQAFREIVSVAAADGMVFDAASVSVEEIRKSAGYAGARVLVPMQGPVTVNNAEAYVAACMAGLGIIQVPCVGVREVLRQGQLVELLSQHVAPPMPLTLVYANRRNLSQRVRVVMDWLASVVEGYLHAI